MLLADKLSVATCTSRRLFCSVLIPLILLNFFSGIL